MQAQASAGLWDFLVFWIFTGSSLVGLPPGERDPALVKAVPPETLIYFEWAARGQGQPGAPGIDGFAADPEIRQFAEQLDAALTLRAPTGEQVFDQSQLRQLQLAKRITAYPGCLFVGFEPLPVDKPGIANWLAILGGVRGGMIFSTGAETDRLWPQLCQCLAEAKNISIDETMTTQTIPSSIPGYSLVMHRDRSRIILAFGDSVLPRIEDGFSGKLPGLDSNLRFQGSLNRISLPRTSTVTWVDTQGLINSATAALGPVGTLFKPVLTMLRLDALDHVVQTSGVEGDSMLLRKFTATGGRTDGLLVLFAGQAIQVQNFSHIPADADLVLAASLSLQGVYQEARTVLITAQPVSVRLFDEVVKRIESDLGMKVVDDVLPAFGNVVTAFDSPSDGGIIASSLIVSLELRDPQKARLVFDRSMKLMEHPANTTVSNSASTETTSLRQQQFLGHSIYYLNSVASNHDQSPAITPTFCLTDRHLLISLNPQAMKSQLRYLRSGQKSFDPVAALKKNPPAGDALLYGYLNGPRAYGVASAAVPYLGKRWLSQLEAHGLALDSFSIPSAPAVAPYFGDSTLVMSRQPDGLLAEAKNLPPLVAAVALLSAYDKWQSWELEHSDGRRSEPAADEIQLGPVGGAQPLPESGEKQTSTTPPQKSEPSAYRKIAPIFLKALVPDEYQQFIPESAIRKLEEGPSPEQIQRREDARRRREELRDERRRRRREPIPQN